MSAFLCSDRHHLFLAKALQVHGLAPYDAQPAEVGALAAALKLENLRSLNARYGDEIPTDITISATLTADHAARIEDRGYVANAADCYDYQACEHAEWRGSPVEVAVSALRERMGADADEIPSYAAAPWGIE